MAECGVRYRWALLASLVCIAAYGQDTQFLPEVDWYLKVNSSIRAYVQAKDDREGGDPDQFTFGPSIRFYRKPLVKLKSITMFDLNDAKSRPLVIDSGYVLITAPDNPVKNRAVEAVTFHFPIFASILLSDRNRADLDWQSGSFSWRYRNRLTLERTFAVCSYHLIPYVAAEPFYESQYSKWSATDLYAGSLFPVGRHVEFNLYYEHENDTAKKPNRQNNYVGLALYMYFSLENSSRSLPHQRSPVVKDVTVGSPGSVSRPAGGP
jgi:hypothetical protein